MRHYLLAALCVAGLFPFQTLLAQSNDIPCGADIFRENALQAGDQLPTEVDLCNKFKVSRSTVREAISRLIATPPRA